MNVDLNHGKSVRSAMCRASAALLAAAAFVAPTQAQTLIYQEGFNTDGEKDSPPRYTITGRDVYEVPRIQSELSIFDQKGPMYWAHNFDASYVGNPNIPARRMIFTWRTDAAGGAATPELLQLFTSSVNWLLNNKANARIVVNPNVASIQELADHLTAAGHTLVDDDTGATPDDQDVEGDLLIHGPGANNASRFVISDKPVIVMNEPDYDDMLVGSIGTLATFAPGPITIATNHPAAGGKTGTFNGFVEGVAPQPFGVVGSFLPPGAITLATMTRVIPPAVNNLGDVDAMIAGTKQHEKTAGTAPTLDFDDASGGNWFEPSTIPGSYTANWGLQITGKVAVATAGTYRFAVGSDDGARLSIDLDKNGLTTADMVLEDPGPHGHQIVYANVAFPAAGTYDFEVRAYNSGGGGSLEVSVSNVAVPVPDDALDSGYWDLLGSAAAVSPVKLQGEASVTGFRATGPDVSVQTPLIVLLNGPSDTPPGSFYDGGPFTGFEGTGFFAASGLNKWPYPDGGSYRTLRLKPVNVAGKSNVKLTVALAATVVDFETSDLLDIVVYTNGVSGNPTTLAHFQGVVNAVQPWLADQKENFVRRLTREFKDFTYDIPAGATDLVVEFRAATSWWTEILAFDNVRITEGASSTTLALQSATAVNGPYTNDGAAVVNAGAKTITIPIPTGMRFYRVSGSAVRLGNVAIQGGNLVLSYQ